MKSSGKKWISFDFGDGSTKTNSPLEKQRNANLSKKLPFNNNNLAVKKSRNFNFDSEIAPKNIPDLAVHSKKIQDLQSWLETYILSKQYNKASFLMLTGPTGSGKTTTLNILCKSMNITIQEWVNPVDQDFSLNYGPGQLTRFQEFLFESKWNSLFSTISNEKKIIMVEDFPNIFLHRPEEFFRILEECSFKTNHPIVFICTDSISKNGVQLSHTLFPQEIRDKHKITNISFNACADTLMKGALKRCHQLVSANLDLLKVPSITTVNAIIATSMGDIRSACNQYHMAALIGSQELPVVLIKKTNKGTKRKRVDNISKVQSMIRDESLGLFHGLGRVLNPKRIEVGESWRLNCDIEKLVDEFSTQPSNFVAFLFENYMKYFGDICDISNASDILSESQLFLNKWIERNDTVMYALWISTLGLMIYNEHRVSQWTQIRGPKKDAKLINSDIETRNLPIMDRYYYNIITKSDKFHKFNLST